MLFENIRELVSKYSFIKKTEFRNAIFYIYYEKEGKLKYKHLPYRTTEKQLFNCIERIKEDINYYEEKKVRDSIVIDKIKKDKPTGFCISNR